jgi:hypothetical protein
MLRRIALLTLSALVALYTAGVQRQAPQQPPKQEAPASSASQPPTLGQTLMSIAEWIRQALDLARRREPGVGGKKLEVIRAAARHDFPSADIDRMLAEIETGYGAGTHS